MSVVLTIEEVIQNRTLEKLFKMSQRAVLTKDCYTKLASFEFMLCDYIRSNVLDTLSLIEAHKILALIAKAQIQILEEKLQEDLDNDGFIGPRRS